MTDMAVLDWKVQLCREFVMPPYLADTPAQLSHWRTRTVGPRWTTSSLSGRRRRHRAPEVDSALPGVGLPGVLSESALSNAFLGHVVEVCLVTEDHRRTMAGLVRLGIGPFRVYTFDDRSLAAPTYRGQDSPFSLKVAFARNAGLSWEVMQPLSGRTIMREFLDAHGEGVHHLAFDCDGAPWDQRVAEFTARGFPPTQSGRWLDRNAFTFFDTEAATTTCFETYHFPEGFIFPEPEEWYPGPPPLPPASCAARV